jgi:hypothetical protein
MMDASSPAVFWTWRILYTLDPGMRHILYGG